MWKYLTLVGVLASMACTTGKETCTNYPFCDQCENDTGCGFPDDDTDDTTDSPADTAASGVPVLGEPYAYYDSFPSIGRVIIVITPVTDDDDDLEGGKVNISATHDGTSLQDQEADIAGASSTDAEGAYIENDELVYVISVDSDTGEWVINFTVTDTADHISNEAQVTTVNQDAPALPRR